MDRNIIEGVIWKTMLRFFLPIVGGSLVQQLYNTVDAIIVGRFVGTKALASVGGSPAIISIIVITSFTGLANGAGVIISQYFGANKKKVLDDAMHTAMMFSFVVSIGLTLFGFFFGDWLLRIMNTPDDIFEMTSLYVRIFFIGMFPTLTYNMGAAVMRAIGDSKRPFYYLLVCSCTNIALDALFVIVFHWGIAGAAIATVISQAVSAVLVVYTLRHGYSELKFSPRKLKIDSALLKEELKVGFPGLVLSLIYGVTNILIQADVNVLGTKTIAAWAAFGKVDIVFWTTNSAFGITAATFVGQNFGAKQMKRVDQSQKTCLAMALGICGALLAMMVIGSKPLLSLFTTNMEVVEIGTRMMVFLVPSYFVYVFIENITGTLRGLGNVMIPTGITLGSLIFIRLPWVLFIFPKYHTLNNLMISYPISWVPAMVCLIGYYMWYKKHQRLISF